MASKMSQAAPVGAVFAMWRCLIALNVHLDNDQAHKPLINIERFYFSILLSNRLNNENASCLVSLGSDRSEQQQPSMSLDARCQRAYSYKCCFTWWVKEVIKNNFSQLYLENHVFFTRFGLCVHKNRFSRHITAICTRHRHMATLCR